jgi:putative endonuclease
MKSYYVYIMASHRRVLYTGVTSKLETRAWQHQHDVFKEGFTARYRVHKLVYIETYSNIHSAIAREKKLKHFTRAEKVNLIESENPGWLDLSEPWKRRPSQILALRSARRKDDISMGIGFVVEDGRGFSILRLHSADGTNRLTIAAVIALTEAIRQLAAEPRPLVLTGNHKFFSAGADLAEISALTGSAAFCFARMGQALMDAITASPIPTPSSAIVALPWASSPDGAAPSGCLGWWVRAGHWRCSWPPRRSRPPRPCASVWSTRSPTTPWPPQLRAWPR